MSHASSQSSKKELIIHSLTRKRERERDLCLCEMNAEPELKEGAATPGWVRDLEKRRQQVNARNILNTPFVVHNTL